MGTVQKVGAWKCEGVLGAWTGGGKRRRGGGAWEKQARAPGRGGEAGGGMRVSSRVRGVGMGYSKVRAAGDRSAREGTAHPSP